MDNRTMFRPALPPSQKRQQGILLLEVLISVLIFSFALLGLVGLQARAIQFSVDAEDRNRAALLANEMISAMWLKQASGSSDLSVELAAWKEKVASPTEGGLTDGKASIVHSGGITTITIDWKTPGSSSTARPTYFTQVIVPGVTSGTSAPGGEDGEDTPSSPDSPNP